MAVRFDSLRVLEAAYSAEADEGAWLRGIVSEFEPLARGGGVFAASFRIQADRMTRLEIAATPGVLMPPAREMRAFWLSSPFPLVRTWFEPVPPVDTMLARLRRSGASMDEQPVRFFSALGVADIIGILGLDPAGHGVHVSLPATSRVHLSPRAQHRLQLVSAHLAAARRLRASVSRDVEAVLDPSGRVEHAVGEARAPAARQGLATAVIRVERARGRLRREEPDGALALWRGLVDGRWSLVDHVEADGRRVILARRNPTGVRDPRALSARERDVLAYVAQGHGNKQVAYALGLSKTTVAAHLRRAVAKLGLRTRRDAIRLFEADGDGDGR
ncbi:MAG: helix-turn-helix transcriptional regulator [Anaeromyxobacteraceae bacterium]